MKKLIYLIAMMVLISSCQKEKEVAQQKVEPVMIKVEANHTTGQIVSSEIILIR
jgi:hypothetical protein